MPGNFVMAMFYCSFVYLCEKVRIDIGRSVRYPITVDARSKSRTVFAHSNAGIMGSNPTRVTDVFVRLFCVCVVLSAGSGLATG
jgi:hypothetical protein